MKSPLEMLAADPNLDPAMRAAFATQVAIDGLFPQLAIGKPSAWPAYDTMRDAIGLILREYDRCADDASGRIPTRLALAIENARKVTA